jgi:hypothetical protein
MERFQASASYNQYSVEAQQLNGDAVTQTPSQEFPSGISSIVNTSSEATMYAQYNFVDDVIFVPGHGFHPSGLTDVHDVARRNDLVGVGAQFNSCPFVNPTASTYANIDTGSQRS